MANVYREFPALDGVPAYMMARLILEARLSPKDVQIAASRLIWAMDYADIGAAVAENATAAFFISRESRVLTRGGLKNRR